MKLFYVKPIIYPNFKSPSSFYFALPVGKIGLNVKQRFPFSHSTAKPSSLAGMASAFQNPPQASSAVDKKSHKLFTDS